MVFKVNPCPDFSWSNSRKKLLEECGKRYFYNYYGKHHGWLRYSEFELLHPEAKRLYQLSKIENVHSMFGNAVHLMAANFFEKYSKEKEVMNQMEQKEIIKQFITKTIEDSRDIEKWRSKPKYINMLQEFYYSKEILGFQQEFIDNATKKVESIPNIIENLHNSKTLNEIKNNNVQFIEIDEAQLSNGGDPNHVVINGVKVYALLDLLYKIDNKYIIVDWKTGNENEDYYEQLCLYVIYVRVKYGIPYEDIVLRIEYLSQGTIVEKSTNVDDMKKFKEIMDNSIKEMKDLLDLYPENKPKNIGEFKANPSQYKCKMCPFREVCEDKFINGGDIDEK